MCFWFFLGALMHWVEAEKPVDIDGHPVEHDWYAPLPKPPEYLRNIPYEREAVAEAERIVSRR